VVFWFLGVVPRGVIEEGALVLHFVRLGELLGCRVVMGRCEL
jgi:hypothetical protein